MNDLLISVLWLSLSGSLFILALYLCKSIVRHKLSKGWQYYIWLIVIARLLLPFSLEVNVWSSFVGNLESRMTTPTPKQEVNFEGLPDSMVPNNNYDNLLPPTASNDQTNNSIVTEMQAKSLMQQLSGACSALLSNAWVIWLVVAFILLIRKITIYQSFIRYIKAGRTEVSDIEHLEMLGKIAEQLKIKHTVGLYTNSLISSPLLIGFFKPCIILPTTEFSDEDFKNTILHELIHYKRLDMFYKWLVQLTICLHWFNPLVYLMGREINHACELSCDEAVIGTLNPREQKAYGDTLLNVLAMGKYNQQIASLSLNESKELMKERLDSIMNFKKKSVLVRCTMFLLTFIFLCGFSVTGVYAKSNEQKIYKDLLLSTPPIPPTPNNYNDDKFGLISDTSLLLLKDQLSYADGFESNNTVVLENDSTVHISTKISVMEGELNFTIQPMPEGCYFSGGNIYDAKGKLVEVLYQAKATMGNNADDSATIILKAGQYYTSLKSSGIVRNAKWEIMCTTVKERSTPWLNMGNGDGQLYVYSQTGYYQDGYIFEMGWNLNEKGYNAYPDRAALTLADKSNITVSFYATCKNSIKQPEVLTTLTALLDRLKTQAETTGIPLEKPLFVSIEYVGNKDVNKLAEEYYSKGDITSLSAIFFALDKKSQQGYFNKIFDDGKIALFAAILETNDLSDDMINQYAEKAYLEEKLTFFTVTVPYMTEDVKQSWIVRSSRDKRVTFLSVLQKQ